MRGHLALLAMLLLAAPLVPLNASGSGESKAPQPSVERVIYGDQLFGFNDWIEFHDTDGDGLGEMITQGTYGLSAFDPPSFAGQKLSNKSFQAYARPIYEDLGGNGSIQILLVEYLSERSNCFAGTTVNIYDGKDFRQLWRSPAFNVPQVSVDGITIKDIDNDREKEMIFDNIEHPSNDNTHRLYVYGGASHELEWTSPVFPGPIRIFYDNIDTDPVQELLVETYDRNYSKLYTGLALAVFDGATHEMQWEIPQRQDFYFDLRPWLQGPQFSYQRDLRDLDRDGIKDPVVLFQDLAGELSGLQVHSGDNGTIVWKDVVAGPSSICRLESPQDIADMDGDGHIEILATAQTPDGNGTNSTDIRMLNATNGALEWNTTIAGSVFKNEIVQLDTDPGAELLLTETGPPRPGNWSCEIYDLKDHVRSWGMDLENGPDFCLLYTSDTDQNGISELIFANTTVTKVNYTYYEENRTFMFSNTTYQVLDGKTFAPRWTSQVSTNESMHERLLVISFDAGLPPVILVNTFGMEDGERVNNTVRIFSTTDFRELANLTVRDGTAYFHAMDYLGGPGKELVISVTGHFPGWKESIYIIDTSNFQVLWKNPERDLGAHDSEDMKIMSADIIGDSDRELVSCDSIVNHYDYTSKQHSEIIAYGGPGLERIWTSGVLDTEYRLCGLGDLDGDSKDEALVQIDVDEDPLIFIEFPANGTTGLPGEKLPDGLLFQRPSLNILSPIDGQRVYGSVNISGNASDALGIDSISLDITAISYSDRRYVDLYVVYSNDRHFATWYGVWNSSPCEYPNYTIIVSVKNRYSQYTNKSINVTLDEPLPVIQPAPAAATNMFKITIISAIGIIVVLAIVIFMFSRKRS